MAGPESVETAKRRRDVNRTRVSFTTSTPDVPPPRLLCPRCDQPLIYRHTVIGGVKPIERWDHFICRACGPFVYRDRTRRLRSAI